MTQLEYLDVPSCLLLGWYPQEPSLVFSEAIPPTVKCVHMGEFGAHLSTPGWDYAEVLDLFHDFIKQRPPPPDFQLYILNSGDLIQKTEIFIIGMATVCRWHNIKYKVCSFQTPGLLDEQVDVVLEGVEKDWIARSTSKDYEMPTVRYALKAFERAYFSQPNQLRACCQWLPPPSPNRHSQNPSMRDRMRALLI
jgi:hypothetical protein